MKRKLFALILGLTLLFGQSGIPVVHAQEKFNDSQGPYDQAIHYLKSKKVVQGYKDNSFRPTQPVTRAEFLKMLLTNQTDEPVAPTQFTYPYEDVPHYAWYAPTIERAWKLGLLDHQSRLKPDDPITRVEGTRLVLNLLGLPIPRTINAKDWPLNFHDVRYDTWYAPIVMYGTQYSLIKPLDPQNGYFRPLKKLTRGEAANLVYNMDVYLFGTRTKHSSMPQSRG